MNLNSLFSGTKSRPSLLHGKLERRPDAAQVGKKWSYLASLVHFPEEENRAVAEAVYQSVPFVLE